MDKSLGSNLSKGNLPPLEDYKRNPYNAHNTEDEIYKAGQRVAMVNMVMAGWRKQESIETGPDGLVDAGSIFAPFVNGYYLSEQQKNSTRPLEVPGPTRQVLDKTITEADFTTQVVELAQTLEWRVVHFRPARVFSEGVETYRTAGQGDIRGFPDILALKGRRMVAMELKSEDAPGATEEQHEWLVACRFAGAETYIMRPSDWPDILKILDPEGRLK